ncbi:MAG: HEAT repeat domain-containing protein [Pseudonocardiaceae bacterium]
MATNHCEKLTKGLREAPLKSVRERQMFVAWLDSFTDIKGCIVEGLQKASEATDWLMFDMYVLAASRHPSKLYTAVLCDVLDQQIDDVNNEDIVDLLGGIGDQAAVHCLEGTLWWQPPWDEYRQLGVKVVWALAAIGTPDALAVLRDAAQSEAAEIRRAAAEELEGA